MTPEESQKHPEGMRAFIQNHEDAVWAVVLGIGLLLMSLYAA